MAQGLGPRVEASGPQSSSGGCGSHGLWPPSWLGAALRRWCCPWALSLLQQSRGCRALHPWKVSSALLAARSGHREGSSQASGHRGLGRPQAYRVFRQSVCERQPSPQDVVLSESVLESGWAEQQNQGVSREWAPASSVINQPWSLQLLN